LKQKLLIIGGSGLVGSTLTNYAESRYNIHITYNNNFPKNTIVDSTAIDLLDDRTKIINLIKLLKPDIVVHTAAHPNVDICEINHTVADTLHVDVTQEIVDVCDSINSKLIYLSTDAVFEGELNKKYTEDDVPNPINYYGKTKLAAEEIILNISRNVVLRTSVIYGWHEKSRFTNWILHYLKEKKHVDPFSDQYNTPTLVDDLSKSILEIIRLEISGLYHATGKTCINRYEFALKLANQFGYDKNLIKSTTSDQKKQDAPRPNSTCLDSKKLEDLINYKFCNIENGISFIHQKSISK
jgi:dTDP-4-dehydrorhamnose reductase